MKYLVKIDLHTLVRNQNVGDTETLISLGTIDAEDGSPMQMVYRTVKHPPVPEFSFGYQDTIIKCSECDKSSEIADLEYDSKYEGKDKVASSETICPHCGAWDCCQLEYQQVDDLKLDLAKVKAV